MATLNPEFPQPQVALPEGPEDTQGLAVSEDELFDVADVEELEDNFRIAELTAMPVS